MKKISNFISNLLTIVFYSVLFLTPCFLIFEDFKSPWNWIILITYLLCVGFYILFMLVILLASLENAFPPHVYRTIMGQNNRPQQKTMKLLPPANDDK